MRTPVALFCFMLLSSFSRTFEHAVESPASCEWTCGKGDIPLFDELIVSWNGFRPQEGKWMFWIRLCQEEEWSPWLKYAEWRAASQKTFQDAPEGSFAKTYQDAASPKQGFCNGYQIKVVAEEGADLRELHALFACASNSKEQPEKPPVENLPFAMLPDLFRQSQMVLDHPRHKDLCSPTSTSIALNTLLKEGKILPLPFAKKAHDDEWDIYGNWILNTAQAYQEANGKFCCHVRRLNHFGELHQYLLDKLPVVVSIRGPIPGSAQFYKSGHLICIVGYDPQEQKVHCIDPAFPDNSATYMSYPLADFLTAWERRGNIAYVFPRKG